MNNNDRQTYIQFGVNNNVSADNINQALSESGMPKLSKIEYQRINDGTYGLKPLEYTRKWAKDLGGGLATIYGAVGEYIRNEDVRKAMNKSFNEYIDNAGAGGAILDMANMIMSPYNNLTIQKAATQPITETITDVASGSVAHPIDATINAIPFLGVTSKAIKSTKTGSNLINKGIQALDKVPGSSSVKSLIKGTKEHTTNQILNNSKIIPSAKIEELNNLNTSIKMANKDDLIVAIKNLEEGTRTGTPQQLQLTENLKKARQGIDDTLVSAGFSPNIPRELAIHQYITRTLQKQNKNIPIETIRKHFDSPYDNKVPGVSDDEMVALYKQGEELFNNGFIYPVKHSGTATTVREGFVDETTKKLSFPNARLYGTQSYDDLAKSLKATGYDDDIAGVNRYEQATGAAEQLGQTVGRKINDYKNLDLSPDEIVYSPTLLKEKIGTSIYQGKNIDNDIKELLRGLNKEELEVYKDDLYAITKNELKALERAYTNPEKNLITGITQNEAVNMAKKAALSTPRYTIGNITTNAGLNLTQGVTAPYYLKAIERMDDIPDTLKYSTTFSGYLGRGIKNVTPMSEIYKNIFKTLKEGNIKDKAIALSDAFTIPMFKFSGAAETLDRSANYMYQVERYANETKQTIKEVLNAAKEKGGNNPTFRELMDRINSSLGDYTGRNYYTPSMVTDTLSALSPFYRPYTQGARVFGHMVMDRPIRNQIFNIVPSRYGNQISETAQEEMNVTPNERYGGGFPVLPAYGKMPSRVVINPYHAYSALGEVIGNPSEALGGNLMGLAPVLGLAGKNKYNQDPVLPNQITINGRKIQLDNNGNEISESFSTRLPLTIAQSLQAYFAPVNVMNSTLLPLIATMAGKEYRKPVDTSIFGTIGDTNIPMLMQSEPTSKSKQGIENLLPMLGFYYSDTYPERKMNMRERARALRKLQQRAIRNERR